jgi:hypothetical protein
MLEVCTGGDAHCDAHHERARQLDKFGKIDVNFAKDMVAGFMPLTSIIPSSLKETGDTQHPRAVK